MEAATVDTGGNSAPASPAPSSFAEAFASEQSPSPDPVDSSTTPPAAETPGTETAASPQQADERSPFIPRDRFDEVNTKFKTLQEWKDKYAWAEREDVQQVIQMVQASKGDPMAFFAQQFSELSGHPVFGPQLRSFLGQQFAGLRTSKASESASQEPQPDVAIYDQQGQEVGRTYSAKALAEREAFLKQQWLQEVKQSLAPELDTVKTIAQERQQAAAKAEADGFASTFMQELSSIPGFDQKTHGPLLAAELAKLQLGPDTHPAVVEAAARKALLTVVLPTLGQKAQSTLLDTLKHKAAASTSVNPNAAAPSTPRSITRFDQLGADAWK